MWMKDGNKFKTETSSENSKTTLIFNLGVLLMKKKGSMVSEAPLLSFIDFNNNIYLILFS